MQMSNKKRMKYDLMGEVNLLIYSEYFAKTYGHVCYTLFTLLLDNMGIQIPDVHQSVFVQIC